MTAELFYEVLLGEINIRNGDPSEGFSLILDSARRTHDPALFQRAVEIALMSRSGDAALAASRAWKEALPDSRDARRFELQILVALGRIEETTPLLRAELAATPKLERPALMEVIARHYSHAPDKKKAATVVEQALVDEIRDPANAGQAWAAIGRVRLAGDDTSGAIEAAIKGHDANPEAEAEAPILLALELVGPNQPLAEPLVKRYLERPGVRPAVRMGYARVLAEASRYDEAAIQLKAMTEENPQQFEPWLLLGGLQVRAHQDEAAEQTLRHFIELVTAQKDIDESRRTRALTQGYMLLAQLAEHRKDYAGADAWLARIDNSEDSFQVQVRRATLLARQGQIEQARQMVHALPALDADGKREKFQAEVQLLREVGQYQAAYDMIAQARASAPANPDLLYDQAMMAEKLGRFDEMERLLLQLIELKPDEPQAYNALGYSLADRNIRLTQARELIRKAAALAPNDPFIADSLGWVEYRLGNLGEAARILEQTYKRRPDPEIAAHLGEVMWFNNQREQALAIWRKARQADPGNEVLQETLKRLQVKL